MFISSIDEMAALTPNWVNGQTVKLLELFKSIEQNMRSEELGYITDLYDDAEIVAIGCSVTSALALPEKYSWPRIIEQTTGERVNVCASSGSSAMLLYYLFLEMLGLFNKPKTVYALVPHLYRLLVPNNAKNSLPIKTVFWSPLVGAYVDPAWDNVFALVDIPRSSIKRKKIQVTTHVDAWGSRFLYPMDLGIQQSIMAIEMMWRTSKLIESKFSISSWHQPTLETLLKINTPGVIRDRGILIDSECARHAAQNKKQSEVWTTAYDQIHFGLHHHIHYAESFLGRDIDNTEIMGLN